MNTIAKVAELIGQALNERPNYKHLEIARTLDNSGLLMLDLPQPELEYEDSGACWLDGDTASVEYHYDSAPGEFNITAGVAYDLTPITAKKLAYMLLAAAQWAERELKL